MLMIEKIDRAALERWADVRKTSLEIAEAIMAVATDEDSAQRIWEEPTTEEAGVILFYACLSPGEAGDKLHWGAETFTR